MTPRKDQAPDFMSSAINELRGAGFVIVRCVDDPWFTQCFAANSTAVVRFELELRDQAVHVHVAAVENRDSLVNDLRNAPSRFHWISLTEVLQDRAPAEVIAPEFPAGTPFDEQAHRQAVAIITHCRDLLDGNVDAFREYRSSDKGPARQSPNTQQMRSRLSEMIGDEKLGGLLRPGELDAMEEP